MNNLAVNLYTGTPSSGKSYETIEDIFKKLKSGGLVIANFPVKFTEKEIKKGYNERFTYVTNGELTIEFLIRYCLKNKMIKNKKEGQCLVVVDEAGGRFNCREFGRSDRSEWVDFFSQHAKFGFNFILVSQTDKMIDKQIRGFAEYEYKHRKMNNFGIGQYLPWTLFVSVCYWYAVKQKQGSRFFFYKKKVAGKYDRYRIFEGFKLSDKLMELIKEEATELGENPFDEITQSEVKNDKKLWSFSFVSVIKTAILKDMKNPSSDDSFRQPIDAIYNDVEADGGDG